jgi:hypothetical protein
MIQLFGAKISDSNSVYDARNKNDDSELALHCILGLYSGESGAFRCLAAGKGEVAFIELNTIKQNTGNSKSKISYLSYIY